MKILKIAKGVGLPLEIVTQTIAIIAKRRSGKSYTMRKLVEQLLDSQQQVVLVDPKGDQWGLRSSADGRKKGYPIVILGGEHGDAPLEASAGEVVAKLVVEERVSVLLDLSSFRKHEVATFMAIFLENLYRLKAKEAHRTPMMLVVDEADAIAPQKPQRGEERMLGAISDIVRRGGQRGIGCALITQRSAVLNKDVLTQAQMLIVLRTIAPQDIAAMRAWIEVHGTLEEGKELIGSLPSLPIGDAWFWSPGWPTAEGIFVRSHVLPIETFDSGATPKPGQKAIVPKNLADVDLDVLKKQMTATIEKAKADDPRILRATIASLEKDLKNVKVSGASTVSNVSQADIDRAVSNALAMRDKEWKPQLEAAHKEISRLGKTLTQIGKLVGVESYIPTVFTSTVVVPKDLKMEPGDIIAYPKESTIREVGDLTGPEQKVLDGIAWMEKVGVEKPERSAVAFLAGYSNTRSTGFTNPCGALRTKGLVIYPNGDTIALTDDGRAAAEYPDLGTIYKATLVPKHSFSFLPIFIRVI